MRLEAGAQVSPHVVRGWWWGPAADLEWISARAFGLEPDTGAPQESLLTRRTREELAAICDLRLPISDLTGCGRGTPPTVLIVHALTGDMRAGGPGGWWGPLIGPGKAIDPFVFRVLCFNNLGSCYGTVGPADKGFPRRSADCRYAASKPRGKGAMFEDEASLPATITSWDLARSILLALDAMGVDRVDLVAGGSLGGMVALGLAALAPRRFLRLATFGATAKASPWQIGWNHAGRQAILTDPGFPDKVTSGLELARQIGHMTYRAPRGLEMRQGRRMAEDELVEDEHDWSPRRAYAVETYLVHQGRKLGRRFDALSYLTQLDAMDHHDLGRSPVPDACESWTLGDADDWGPERITASTLAVGIDSDVLFPPEEMAALAQRLRSAGGRAEYRVLHSAHGHDAFLIEFAQVGDLLREALSLPPGPTEE